MKTHNPRKRFGQNFLRDEQVIRQIVAAINPLKNERIVEIGPGQGALTQEILPHVKQLIAIEIDRDLIEILKHKFETVTHLQLFQADALRFDFNELFNEQRLRVIGNLPYNISTPLLFHLFQFKNIFQDMHFMLQKEVVERMQAKHNEDAYGRLSVMTQYHCQVEMLFKVPSHAFVPAPKVESAIVRLIPFADPPYVAKDYKHFEVVVRTAFNQRRKTLRNALKTIVSPEVLQTIGIDSQLRPENLGVREFVSIANMSCTENK